MKKALSVFLMAAMAFGAFADEPVADVNVAEFSGNAKVEWGVDLDSGTTGFQNSTDVTLKLNLLNGGSKSTTGDGVWGELVIKTDGDTFVGWNNTTKDGTGANKGMGKDLKLGVKVDTAKIHFGPAYVGIKSGDTQTGELKMDAAIRSADKGGQSKWLNNVGLAGYSQGIVAGYDSDMFKVEADLRSKLSGTYQYTDNYAAALEGTFKGVENLAVTAGVSYNFAKNYQANKTDEDKTPIGNPQHTLGYSASAGYKLALNDTFFVRPQLGFAGATEFGTQNMMGTKFEGNSTTMDMAAGVLFGWGDIGQDKNAGVYFLDKDDAKKVTPGVALVAEIPLPTTKSGEDNGGKKGKQTTTKTTLAWIQPSFYTGEIIPGLTAAAYADIQIAQKGKTKTTYDGKTLSETEIAKPDAAMAFAFGVKYALNVEEMTITPQFGLRFVNEEYVATGRGNKVFDGTNYDLGQSKGDDDYLNVKLGVDVAGLVDNTTFSVVWTSENLNNKTDAANTNDPKFGTLNFGAKIAL